MVYAFLCGKVLIVLVSEQGENIRDYARYLQVRVQTWRELKFDFASQNPGGDQVGRLKKLSVDKGLLREVEGVSRLVGALLKCKVCPRRIPLTAVFHGRYQQRRYSNGVPVTCQRSIDTVSAFE
jgi:hypothetical protein